MQQYIELRFQWIKQDLKAWRWATPGFAFAAARQVQGRNRLNYYKSNKKTPELVRNINEN